MPAELPKELTQILNQAVEGDESSVDQVWCTVYADLRNVARRTLGTPKIGERHAPGPTTVVERAFLHMQANAREAGQDPEDPWKDRRSFFVAIAREMVRFLLEHRRNRGGNGRGGFARSLPLDLDFDSIASFDAALLATDAGVFDSLVRLEDHHRRAAEAVWLRYVCGLTINQTAQLLEIKPRTVCKNWNFAKAWIRRDLQTALGRVLPEAV